MLLERFAFPPICVLGLVIAALLPVLSHAQVPTTINYQGRLLQNTADQDAVTGTVDVVFSIWTGPAGDGSAAQLWSETWSGVEVSSNGIFSVLLGSNGSPLTPSVFQTDTTLYLQLQVDGETLLPRQQLGSAAFAMVDDPANELQDLVLSGDSLSLTDSAVAVDLTPYLDDTDQQDLSLSGTTLSLSNDPSPVDLSGFLDNTDVQTLSLSGDQLTISGSGSTVDLAASDTVRTLETRIESIGDMVMRTVFVSSATYDGAFGGLGGADAECQSLADAAGLPGIYKAWLSDSTGSPSTRFDRFGSFESVDGTVVADSWADLTDGSLDTVVSQDETGAAVGGGGVWTNTAVDGSSAGSNHCGNWTSTSGSGVTGLAGDTGSGWTQSSLGSCADPLRLYCFQQSSFVNTDNQALSLAGNSLVLTSDDGTDTVDLAGYLDNTDDQTLSLSGTTLTISGSNSSVELSSFTNTDEQTLSLSGDSLTISGSNSTVDLSTVDDQTLSLSGNTLQISDSGSTVSLASYLDNTDSQSLSLSGTTLSISGSGSTVGLSAFLDNTDSQNLNNVLAQGGDANNRDITNVDDMDIDKLTIDEDFECDASTADCIRSEHIEQDTILGNDITDRIFIVWIDCNGSCSDMSMREACDSIEDLRGLDFEVELMGVSCVHDVPSTTSNGFVDCPQPTDDDNECRAFELRTLGDIPCLNGDGADAIVTCYQTDIAK